MGVLPVIVLILALKIPIVGLWMFVYWLMKEPTDEADAERVRAKLPPRLPEPGDQLRPRRRHGKRPKKIKTPAEGAARFFV